MATLYPPGRALRIWLRDALRRLLCHHLVMPDEYGRPCCVKCRAWLL